MSDSNSDSQHVVSAEEKARAPTPAAAPAPVSPLRAWSVALGCFFVFMASFGFVVSFGVFQAYYQVRFADRYSASDVAWIGSLQLAGLYGLGVPSAILMDRVGAQWTVAIGGFFAVLGVLTASAATQYWQVFLSHGVCCTIGYGLLYIPAVTLPQQYFVKQRATVVGLCVGGSSVGGVLWSIVFNQMLNKRNISYGWTMRTIGLVQLALLAVAALLCRSRMPHHVGVSVTSFPWRLALCNVQFVVFSCASLVGFLGLYGPYFYVPLYGVAIGASSQTAFYMSAVLNAATFFGRLLLGVAADRVGYWNALIGSMLLCSMLNFAWIGVDTAAGLYVFSAVYGFFSGSVASLQGPCNYTLCPEPKLKMLGPFIAIASMFSALGALGGQPISGRLLTISLDDGDRRAFHGIMYFSGAVLLLSTAMMLTVRLWLSRGLKM